MRCGTRGWQKSSEKRDQVKKGGVGSVVTTVLRWSDGKEASKMGRRSGTKEGNTVQTSNENQTKDKDHDTATRLGSFTAFTCTQHPPFY